MGGAEGGPGQTDRAAGYHNHARRHLATGGRTLGEAADIHIDSGNKRLTLIEFAVRPAANTPD